NMREIVVHLGTANSLAILTAIVGLIVILAAQKYIPKIPGALLGLLVSTFIAVLFFQGQVETIGSAYGEIPRQLPTFAFPELTIEKMMYLLPPAIVVAR
ncbi:sodium-independent anion transporter, partial [Bacillus cereus]|nr:sodium-independent anion transporter [Bacillus cereus]